VEETKQFAKSYNLMLEIDNLMSTWFVS